VEGASGGGGGCTLRADHWPGLPPLSPALTSSLISSRRSGSVYFSFGGMLAIELFEKRRGSGRCECEFTKVALELVIIPVTGLYV